MNLAVPILAILSMLFGPAVVAEVYKCTDASGRVQYRDTPCDSRTQTLRKIDQAGTDTGAPDARMQKTQRLLDAMRDERQQKQRLAEEQKAEQEQRRMRCNQARDFLHNLERAGRVYKLDESGRRDYLPDDGREQAIEQARANVQHWCN